MNSKARMTIILLLALWGTPVHAQQGGEGGDSVGTGTQIAAIFGTSAAVTVGFGIGALVLSDDDGHMSLGGLGIAGLGLVVPPLAAAGMTLAVSSQLQWKDLGTLVAGAYVGTLVVGVTSIVLWHTVIDSDWDGASFVFALLAIPVGATLGSLVAASIATKNREDNEAKRPATAPLMVQFSF